MYSDTLCCQRPARAATHKACNERGLPPSMSEAKGELPDHYIGKQQWYEDGDSIWLIAHIHTKGVYASPGGTDQERAALLYLITSALSLWH